MRALIRTACAWTARARTARAWTALPDVDRADM